MISQPRLVSVNRIWDRSPHNAFTDLRDPKLFIMPDGRLLLLTGGSLHENGRYRTRSPRSYWIGTTRPPYVDWSFSRLPATAT